MKLRNYYTFRLNTGDNYNDGRILAYGTFPAGDNQFEAEYRDQLTAIHGSSASNAVPRIVTVSGTTAVPASSTFTNGFDLVRIQMTDALGNIDYDSVTGEPDTSDFSFVTVNPPPPDVLNQWPHTGWSVRNPLLPLAWEPPIHDNVTANGADKFYFQGTYEGSSIVTIHAPDGLTYGQDSNGHYVTSTLVGEHTVTVEGTGAVAVDATLTFGLPFVPYAEAGDNLTQRINGLIAALRHAGIITT